MDPLAVRAASRLEAIGRHVVPSGEDHLERHPTAAGAASRVRLAPGGGPGTLTVVDNRTGKKYEIPVQDGGFVSSVAFKAIKAGGDGSGLRMFDPGYMNTAPCKSKISYIDGDAGILRYRGYPIEVLAEKSSYRVRLRLAWRPSRRRAAPRVGGDHRASFRPSRPRHRRHRGPPPRRAPHGGHPRGPQRVIHLPPEQNPAIQGGDIYPRARRTG